MLESDQHQLRSLAKACKDAAEKIRLLALHAISIGNSVPHTAAVFCVDEATIRRWITRWEEERDLSNKAKGGRPPKLTAQDRKKLRKRIKENNPRKFGFHTSSWDTKELCAYFAGQGIEVSRELVRRELRKMGAHYVKAQITFAQADEKARQEFASEFLTHVNKMPSNTVVLFEDEMSAGCSPRRGYGWTFEKQLVINAPQTYRRLNVFGAVNPLRGKVIQFPTKNAKAPSFVKLLKRILRTYPRKHIWLYADGCNVHKAKLVRKFLKKHPRMKIQFLPPYSPDMNPVEHLWLYYRSKLLNNRYFKSTHELATNIHAFTRSISPERIMEICSLNPVKSVLT